MRFGVGRFRRRWFVLSAPLLIIAAVLIWYASSRWTRPLSPLQGAQAAYDRRDWSGSNELARAWLAQHPDDREALRIYARSVGRLGRVESAKAVYDRLGNDGAGAEDYLVLGLLQRRFGQPSLEATALRSAVSTDTRHAEARSELAGMLLGRDLPAEAEAVAAPLRDFAGWEARGGWLFGRARLRREDAVGAVEALAAAARLDPLMGLSGLTPTETRRLLARAFLQAGRPAEAREAIAGGEADPLLRWLLSRAALQEGKSDEGLRLSVRARAEGLDATPLEPAPYLGSARCAACHEDRARTHRASRHARTFARIDSISTRPIPLGTTTDPRNPRVRHEFSKAAGKTEVQVSDEATQRSYRGVVEFLLGSGDGATTMVVRDESGGARELRLSQYREVGWDLTLHHPELPGSIDGYLGRPLSADSLDRCLQCHATTARTVEGTGVADRAIGCETCHGPGGHHVKAVDAEWDDLAIAIIGRDRATEVIGLCGRCHSANETTRPSDPEYIRFQTSTLVLSACYIKGMGRLDCLTCHDPHSDRVTKPEFYIQKCIKCHADSPQTPDCPVDMRGDCLKCHMPSNVDAVPHTRFTDHQIRIHKNR